MELNDRLVWYSKIFNVSVDLSNRCGYRRINSQPLFIFDSFRLFFSKSSVHNIINLLKWSLFGCWYWTFSRWMDCRTMDRSIPRPKSRPPVFKRLASCIHIGWITRCFASIFHLADQRAQKGWKRGDRICHNS